jgi:hypothetical protein
LKICQNQNIQMPLQINSNNTSKNNIFNYHNKHNKYYIVLYLIKFILKLLLVKVKNIFLSLKLLNVLFGVPVKKLFINYYKGKLLFKMLNLVSGIFVLMLLRNKLIFIIKKINRILCLVAILVFFKHLSEIILKKLISHFGKWYFIIVCFIVNSILKEMM